MNKTQAFKALLRGEDVVLVMKYWERTEKRLFKAKCYGLPERKTAFECKVKCAWEDFKGICTFYKGSKSDCKKVFVLYKDCDKVVIIGDDEVRKNSIEKEWITDAGFPAVVVMTHWGHRCGYVGLSNGHPLYGIEYYNPIPDAPIGCNKMVEMFPVFGGVTYTGKGEHAGLSEHFWWVGFSLEYGRGEEISKKFCYDECEKLAEQILTRGNK